MEHQSAGSQVYSICGVNLALECALPEQFSGIQAFLQRFFVLEGIGRGRSNIHLRFQHPGTMHTHPQIAEEVYLSQRMEVLKTQSGFYLHCGSSVLDLDLIRGECVGVIAQDFWDRPIEDQREFFLLGLLMLLRPYGCFGLHGNGVAKEGMGALIVGGAGCGKTTLTLMLVQEGWSYVSDDALVLHKVDQGIEALALRRGFSCTPETLSCFPELGVASQTAERLADGKMLLEIGSQYSSAANSGFMPDVLLFPQIVSAEHTKLVPLGETRAMVALIEQSPGIMTDRELVKKQVAVLTALVEQSRCYSLLQGNDVFQNPAEVSDLILNTG